MFHVIQIDSQHNIFVMKNSENGKIEYCDKGQLDIIRDKLNRHSDIEYEGYDPAYDHFLYVKGLWLNLNSHISYGDVLFETMWIMHE